MPKLITAKKFEAVLDRSGDRLNWTIVRIPFDVARIWGKRGQLRVKGEINGFAFRTSLFPTGQGSHILMVNKKMQTGGKAAPGTKAKFRLEPDTAPREVSIPPELLGILRQSKALQKYFDSLNYSNRYQIAVWVAEGKLAETRRRRAEQMAERLLATMEAERELPPVLQVAIQHNPKAKAGWNLMPSTSNRQSGGSDGRLRTKADSQARPSPRRLKSHRPERLTFHQHAGYIVCQGQIVAHEEIQTDHELADQPVRWLSGACVENRDHAVVTVFFIYLIGGFNKSVGKYGQPVAYLERDRG
jgi:hypothetical protein